MSSSKIREMSIFEHRFWLQILGDHSRFILNALSPEETRFIDDATQFIKLFDYLLEKARRPISLENLHDLNYKAYSAAMKIRELKMVILSKQITDKIKINIAPTFINHMVNELDEYIFILNHLIKGNIAPIGDINLHLLWLPDGSGHASTIASNLDMTYKELIKKSVTYSKDFDNLYLRTIEYKGYTRSGICGFPALKRLNADANEIMNCFKIFLKKLEIEILEKKVLGTIYPLMLNHMFREECYYLTKLSMVSDINSPECDPTTPRIEA